jgi:hypothetical protein
MFFANLKAQISEGGTPYAKSIACLKSDTPLPQITLKKLDTAKLLEEDRLYPEPVRFGVYTDTIINIKANGKTDIIPEKGKIWRLRIGSESAKSIQIIFKTFVLPQGARLFLYNDNLTRQAGAFTKNNMQKDSTFVLADFKGNYVIVEYFEPDNPEFDGQVIIGSIAQAYKDVYTTQSLSGFININCPVGKDAQLAKHAVCKMTFRSGFAEAFCSGALINNARHNGVPYFLTANHCISKSSEASTLVTYFNYEVVGCDGDTLTPLTLTGASLLSSLQPSDYTLLVLNDMPTSAYQPYYAGWDANDLATKKVTGVHNPYGQTKKISIDYGDIYSNTESISWNDGSKSPASSHWIVVFDEGITTGGSSGSPLFNTKNQIIGQLHGGLDVTEFYGKLSYSFTHKPLNYPAISHYLDPDSTGIKALDGYSPVDNPPDAFFTTESDVVCNNSPVVFNDYSVFGPYDRNWTITPSTFAYVDGTSETSPVPVIEFFEDTNYSVKLNLAVSGVIKSTESKSIKAGNTISIDIKSNSGNEICDCDFNKIRLSASYAQDYSWSIPVEDESKIILDKNTGDTIIVTRLSSFHADSSYTINLNIIGTAGTCADTAQVKLNILKPENDDVANAKLLNYGRSIFYTNVCATVEEGEPIPPHTSCTTQYSWCDEYGTGDSILQNSVWFKFIPTASGTISISSSGFDNELALYEAESAEEILNDNYILMAANDDRSSTDYRPILRSLKVQSGKTYWIQVDGSGGGTEDVFDLNITMLTAIDEQLSSPLMVFPQPAKDIVKLKGEELTKSPVNLSVYSISGQCIYSKETTVNNDEITLDISTWEPGIYLVKINTTDKNYLARIVKY